MSNKRKNLLEFFEQQIEQVKDIAEEAKELKENNQAAAGSGGRKKNVFDIIKGVLEELNEDDDVDEVEEEEAEEDIAIATPIVSKTPKKKKVEDDDTHDHKIRITRPKLEELKERLLLIRKKQRNKHRQKQRAMNRKHAQIVRRLEGIVEKAEAPKIVGRPKKKATTPKVKKTGGASKSRAGAKSKSRAGAAKPKVIKKATSGKKKAPSKRKP